MGKKPSAGRREFLALVGWATGAGVLSSTASGNDGNAAPPETTGNLARLTHLGRYSTGVYDEGAAEIPAYDAGTERLFVVNGDADGIDVLDASTPRSPTSEETISVGMGGPNSVAVHGGTVAVAVEASDTQANGRVEFYSASDLGRLGEVEVGPLPDMVTFTDDGSSVLTANEGEPSDDYSDDPAGSVSVVDVSGGVSDATTRTVSFADYDGDESALRDRGIRIYGEGASASQDLEPEYVATAGTTAYVALQENNALAVVDVETASVTELKPLGYKDHSLPQNALDAVEDDAVDITTEPVYGMYQPDALAAYEVDGETHLVVANEGDAREYDALLETGVLAQVDGRWGLDTTEDDGDNLDVRVDASAFADGVLDRLEGLEATAEYGDIDDDGRLEKLHLFGGRSFSVHDENGTRLVDSGSRLERVVAREQPMEFNSDDDENGRDSESVASGPEPEGIEVGRVGGTPHAFVGLEEVSAIVAFDVSDPEVPLLADYINTRDFSVDPEDEIEEGSKPADAAGDLSPEGLEFVPKPESPIDDPMLAVSYEVSGTTSLYRVGTSIGRTDRDGPDNEFQSSELRDVVLEWAR